MSVTPSTVKASDGFDPVSVTLWLAMFSLVLGSSLVANLAQALGLNFSSLFTEFVVTMVGGFVSAFTFAVAMHRLVGLIIRRRQRSKMDQ